VPRYEIDTIIRQSALLQALLRALGNDREVTDTGASIKSDTDVKIAVQTYLGPALSGAPFHLHVSSSDILVSLNNISILA
jgi:hypothetical protein